MHVPTRRTDLALSLAVFVAWLVAAALSRHTGLWLALGGLSVVLAAAAIVVEGSRLRALLTVQLRPIVGGLLVGGLATLLTRPLYEVTARIVPTLTSDVALLYGRLGATAPAWASLALVIIVVAEEIVWRGAVQGALQRSYGVGLGVLLAAALYALALVPVGSPVLVLVAFACGLLWSGLRAATASLTAPLIAHLLWDQVVLYLAPLQ